MKYTPKQLKRSALHLLGGNWWTAISCYFAYDLIRTIILLIMSSGSDITIPSTTTDITQYIKPVTFLLVSNLILSIILSPFRIGFVRCMLDMSRLKSVNVLRVYSKPECWPTIMLTSFIKTVVTAVASAVPLYMLINDTATGIASVLLSFVLLITKVEFAFIDFILADSDNIRASTAIRQSLRLIKRHRWHYINLLISFLLWFVLCTILLSLTGILFTFVLEIYIIMATACLYNTVLDDNRLDSIA